MSLFPVRKLVLLGTFGLLSACGVSGDRGSSGKDIATNWTYSLTTPYRSLFYVEGNAFVRGECPARQYDRSTCTTNLKRVSATLFYSALESKFGTRIGEYEQEIREAHINIDRIDVKLAEYINPDPGNNDNRNLLRQIEQKRSELSAIDVLLADLNEQMFRIKRELAANEDPGLRLLLADLKLKVVAQQKLRDQAAADVKGLNIQYVNNNSSTVTDRDMFNTLTAQRTRWVDFERAARRRLNQELETVVIYHKTVRLLNDQGYAHAVIDNLPGYEDFFPVVSLLNPVFSDVLRTSGGIR